MIVTDENPEGEMVLLVANELLESPAFQLPPGYRQGDIRRNLLATLPRRFGQWATLAHMQMRADKSPSPSWKT